MRLAEEYRRQLAWRPWATLLDALPLRPGQRVLDLGCAAGDVTALLVARGARVIGVDLNAELLDEARALKLDGADFRLADLRKPLVLDEPADGIWSSFTAAYLPDLTATLHAWGALLRPQGWLALTEVDDLFAHEPLGARARGLLQSYGAEAARAGRYDFQMGRRLTGHLGQAGLTVVQALTPSDQELAFDGPALPEVVEAWSRRLERMKLLHDFCGAEYPGVRDELLACLRRPDHRSLAKVVCCVATR
jgi:SAM-dependent methyltransferase